MNYIEDKKIKVGLKKLQDQANLDKLLLDINLRIDKILINKNKKKIK